MRYADRHTIIVGAGLVGLSTAHVLREAGIPVTVLDAASEPAASWRRRHPGLRLNIHRRFAALPGRPAPASDGAFLTRDTLIAHLEAYARDLHDCIVYGSPVERVDQTVAGWRVQAGPRTFETRNLVLATGRDRRPHVPRWPGRDRFQGKLLHAADLGPVSRFDGKRVLVIGAGNSGSDVLNHLARHDPADVRISVRHGPAIVPQRLFGFPLHRAANLFAAMPLGMVDAAFALTQRLVFGDLRRYGLTSHPMGGGSRLATDGTAFAVDEGFVAAIKCGRFKVVGAVREFSETRVSFDCHRSFDPDVVICATGYRTGLEPLLGHLGVLDDRGVPISPAGCPIEGLPGLWFNGYRPEFQGYFHAAAKAAGRIAQGIADQEARADYPAPDQAPQAVV